MISVRLLMSVGGMHKQIANISADSVGALSSFISQSFIICEIVHGSGYKLTLLPLPFWSPSATEKLHWNRPDIIESFCDGLKRKEERGRGRILEVWLRPSIQNETDCKNWMSFFLGLMFLIDIMRYENLRGVISQKESYILKCLWWAVNS